MNEALSQARVLRIGFGLVLGILLLSLLAAYRIQEDFSRRSAAIHRRHFHQQETLNNLRRISWLASVTARDLFLSPSELRARDFLAQLDELRGGSARELTELAAAGVPAATVADLRARFHDLLEAVGRIPSMIERGIDRYAFVQQEIIPRRLATTDLLREVEQASRRSVDESETEFGETRHSAARMLLILLGINAILGSAVAVYSIRYAERLETIADQQLEEMSRAKQELERLSIRLMEVQEQERTRLARELHDEIVQNLAVLRMEIGRLAQTGAVAPGQESRLERVRAITEGTMKTVRNIMLLLRPSLLDDLGLAPALQWLAEDFERRTGVTCQFSDDAPDEELPDVVKTCVFRVVQEALHNAEKHGEASRVGVRILHRPGRIRAEVEDDGRGFDVARLAVGSVNGSFGLIGMRERAAALGGFLSIDSAPGKGTVVSLDVPVLPAAPADSGLMEKHAQ